MAKPFSIQSPENIAKEYAGNKQRIAEAMQLGIVDATAGVLAGMFIDRMRSAQMQEQVPQQTVAQQVMGGAPPPPPPPPSGGLGATPQAALQAAPQGAPPMAPPMDMPPEMGMAPPGMAEGGIVGLDVPSYMFDEPDNGSYAGGGLVAFAGGSPGRAISFEEDFDVTFGTGPKPPAAPTYYGYSIDPRQNMAIAQELLGKPESKYSGALEKDLAETLDPEAMAKRRKARVWDAVADMGFRLASSRNPSFLGAVGEAGLGALPAAREAKQLEKSEQRYARKALADLEAGRNTQRAQLAAQALQMQQTAIQGYEAETGRKFQASEKKLDRDLEWRIASMREAGAMGRASMRGSGGEGGGGAGRGETVTANRYSELQEKLLAASKEHNAAKAAWMRMGKPRENDKTPRRAAAARAYMDAADVLEATKSLVNSVTPRGKAPPAQAGKGKAVQDGQILRFDAKGNLISG